MSSFICNPYYNIFYILAGVYWYTWRNSRRRRCGKPRT